MDRRRPPPLSTGKERRGCLGVSLPFLFSNKSQTRAQPAAPTAPPPGGRPPAVLPLPEPPRHRPGRARSAGRGWYSRILTLRWSRRARSSSRAPRRRWSRALRWHRESASLRIPPKMSPAQRERSESCISSDTSAYELTCSRVPKSGTEPRRRPPPPSAVPAWSPGAGPPRSAPSPPASSNLHSFSGSRVRRGNGIAAGDGEQRGARQRQGWRGELGVPGAKSLHRRSGRGDKSSGSGEGERERTAQQQMNQGGREGGRATRCGAGGEPPPPGRRGSPERRPCAGVAPGGGSGPGRREEMGGERRAEEGERSGAQHRRTAGAVRARAGRETGKSPAFSPRSEDEAGREGKRKRGRGTKASWMRPQRRKASQRRRGEKARTSSTWGTPRRCRHFSERTKLPTRKARAGKRGGGKGGGGKTSTNLGKAGGRRLPVAPRTGASPFPGSQGSCSRPGPAALGPAGLPREEPAHPASSARPKRPSTTGDASRLSPFPRRAAGQARGAAPRRGKMSSLSGNGAFSVVNFY